MIPVSSASPALKAIDASTVTTPFGLYLHIPFCAARCVYCDFNTYIDLDHLQARYVETLAREIELVGNALGRPPAATIFFGGGTPSLLTPNQFEHLLAACKTSFALAPDAEITTEANPSSVDVAYLLAVRDAGINRVSFGVQSFNAATLNFLGRWHSADEARAAVLAANNAGFDNINLDLIYGLPEQTVGEWQQTIESALALEPTHLSLYALIVEPGTPLKRSIDRGDVPPPDDDVAAAQYDWTIDRLADAGFAQYEISNWARHQGEPNGASPALASQHNLLYWRNCEYAGLGAGAHSYIGGMRYANVRRPQAYIEAVERVTASESVLAPALDEDSLDPIDHELSMREHMMLGLRLTREGVGYSTFEDRFGTSLEECFGSEIQKLVQRGLLERLPDRVRLTRDGYLLANQALIEFL